ncbi:PFL_4669 family integrating conjugative element protein [Gallibacterium anatis]|uniref:Integrating conjugative element protein n=2 Tax=Gallibacterium anatis TaxID=750 RepID=U1GZH1_9PAST|nr:TIGR03761 family integrating conjugative element protein [Gallibacterium anatis]ERF77908.1 hypothetical protein N561_09025 [Gallibacterium anatis 12656/12]HJF74148.1 TIGR03761 family integrating conjugative element protein [Gallibacterium anatis]
MTDLSSIGALRTDITLTLHTHHATRLWQGKQVKQGDKTTTRIVSYPFCLSVLSRIHQHSAQDDPYADNYLLNIETKILSARKEISKLSDQIFDLYTDKIPEEIKLSNSFNVSPIEIPLIVKSAMGYQLIYLLADFDNLARIVMTGAHIAIMSRSDAGIIMNRAAHLIRSILGYIQRYQDAGVNRQDLKNGTALALAAIKRFGELPDDILSGQRRSQFAPINLSLILSKNDNDDAEEVKNSSDNIQTDAESSTSDNSDK